MELDEAIAHAMDVAEGKHPNIDGCSECAAQHGQLADWLEELKRRRSDDVKDVGGMLLYSERRKLADAFVMWAEQNNVAQTPESVVAYLFSKSLLNVQKCHDMIAEKRGEGTNEARDPLLLA